VNNVLIFDFDGVLADSIVPMLHYAQQVCEELGHPCLPTQADLEALEKMEFSEFGLQLGIPQDEVGAFVARNLELFNSSPGSLPIISGMGNVIRKLSQSATLAMITGNSRVIVDNFLRKHDLKSEFQIIFSAEDEGNRAQKILRIVALQNSQNNKFYFVGDAISDIRAARDSVIKSVAVSWGHQSRHKLQKGNPDYTIDKPTDLLTLFAEK
jgi:phosphoglycolate phosphatase-like HAD superfamily hydrolase